MIKYTIYRWAMGLCALLLVAAALPLSARDAALPQGTDFQEGIQGSSSHHRQKRSLISLPLQLRLLIKRLKKNGHNYLGMIKASQMQAAMDRFLGPGYRSLTGSSGRHISKDELKQVRFGVHEMSTNPYHMHFEVFDKPRGERIYNGVTLIKDTSRMKQEISQ